MIIFFIANESDEVDFHQFRIDHPTLKTVAYLVNGYKFILDYKGQPAKTAADLILVLRKQNELYVLQGSVQPAIEKIIEFAMNNPNLELNKNDYYR